MKLMRIKTPILLAIVLLGCETQTQQNLTKPTPAADTVPTERPDPHSYSRHDQVQITHLALNLEVDFEDRVLDGFVMLNYDKKQADAQHLHLDTRDLKIKKVYAGNDPNDLQKLIWRTGASDPLLGTELIIDLPDDGSPVRVYYQTAPEASGLQWLSAAQTSGDQPFLFSQSQAIHARSWIPVQDSPAVRINYDATIQVDEPVKPVFSANNNEQLGVEGVFKFNMPQAIPAYLIAIAIGDVTHQSISEHVSIYAEPPVLEAAVYEFAETENMITATEALYGPYRWGQYDLLVLPPSFPFGGMENPKLSHITPTVIAGDRSLDSLIAHELAHSWSGNLVTNALWQDMWLNEGVTTYIEARIVEAVHGKERMVMEAALAYEALVTAMEKMPAGQQKLVNPDFQPDPDAYFTSVPYDKGRFFFSWLEQQAGRDHLDQFLNQYFDDFAFQSVSSDQFKAYLKQHLLDKHPEKIDPEQVRIWLHEPGLPSFYQPPVTDRFQRIDHQVKQWLQGQQSLTDIDVSDWTTQQWLHFLRALPDQLNDQQLDALNQAFAFNQRQNSEIAHDWLLISINNQYEPAYGRLIEYLTGIGRVKLIKPLYEALMQQPDLHNLAANIYQKARSGYHPIATSQLDLIVGQAEGAD